MFEWDIPIANMWLACPHAHVPYDCRCSAATEAPRCKIAPLIICIYGAYRTMAITAVAPAALADGGCTAVDIGIRVDPLAALINLGNYSKQYKCRWKYMLKL